MNWTLGLLLLLFSCGYKTTAIPEGFTERSVGDGAQISFAAINSQIFTPHCIRCHGSAGGVSLSSYASVKAALTRVSARIESGTMPPAGPLSENLKSLLRNWIAAGSPEGSVSTNPGGGTSGGTTGGTTGGTGSPDFALVRAEVFAPSCISCHSSFGTFAGIKNKLPAIQNAVNSGFMPPSGPLPEAKKGLLNLWVSNGAPEGTSTGGGTSGGDTEECEDDDRLLATGLVELIDDERVLDHEKEIIRRRRRGDDCDDDR